MRAAIISLVEMMCMLHACFMQLPCMFNETCMLPACYVHVSGNMHVAVSATCMPHACCPNMHATPHACNMHLHVESHNEN